MTKSNFDKLAGMPLFARPPRPEDGADPVAGTGRCAPLMVGAGPGARCNSRRSCRRSSSTG